MPNNFGVQISNAGQVLANWVRGLQQDLYQAPAVTIEGIKPSDWPSPNQPVRPIGPADASPLGIRLQMAMNQLFTPRPDATYDARDLQKMAKYPLADICINGVCDAIGDANWSIDPKSLPNETKASRAKRAVGDKNLVTLQTFFEYPDKSNRLNWSEWTRHLVREMMVIDAASILVKKKRNGLVADLPAIPGASINRYVDASGFLPSPPSPAYSQLWEGIPRLNLTTDQLIYKPRNIAWADTLSSMLYGCSPIESLGPEIEVGRQRLAFVDAFYRTGNLPNALQVIPADTPPDKVKRAFELLDGDLSGNLSRRRGIRPIQGFSPDGKDQIVFPEQPILSDAYDDLHIHKMCFGLFTSPQRLIRMMTRATAAESQEAAEEEGLWPVRSWLRNLINYIIQIMMGYSDYEFNWKPQRENDPVKQMTAVTGLTKEGIMQREEAREVLELDPSEQANMNKCGMLGVTGFIPVDMDFVQQAAAPTGEPVPRGARTAPQQVSGTEEKDSAGKKVFKLTLTSAPARKATY